MDAEVILHELLHAATTGRVNEGLLVANKGTELHNSVIKLTELASAVQGAQRKLQHEGLYSTALHGARGGLESQQADIYLMELMTYGLTNKATQDFLKTIPVPGGTAYEEFVLLVKEVLGLGAEDVDALSRLIQTTDDILASPRAELSSVFEAHPVTPQPKFLSKKDWDAREREGTTEKWLRPHMSKQEWMDTYIPPPPHPYSASSASEVGHQRPPLGSPVQELDVKTATEIKQEARKKAMQKP